MRFLRRSLVGIFLLSVTVGLLTYAGASFYGAVQTRMAQEDRVRPARERVLTVNVQTAEPGQITPVLSAFGEVQSRRRLDVRATSAGAVVELTETFEDGGRVAAGQLLLRIDPAEPQSALDLAQNAVDEAEAELRDARRGLALARDELSAARAQVALREQALARQEDLKARGVGTDAAIETAALAVSAAEQSVLSRRQAEASAEARIDAALTRLGRERIDLAEAERQLAETEVRAEFAGTLSETAAVKGGLVGTNERLAVLIDPDNLEVAFRVSTSQYARLLDSDGGLIDAPVEVSLDVFGTDITTTGRITRESAAVGAGQTGRLLFAALDRAQGFRQGDFVTVSVREPPLDRVVLLPATAVNASGFVLVVGEDERLEEVATEVLRRQGDDVIVRAQTIAGRNVVTERTPLTGAGIKVRAVRPGGATPAPAPEMLELSEERRARLVAFVEGNARMPQAAKDRVLAQLSQPTVSAETVQRIESRMGG